MSPLEWITNTIKVIGVMILPLVIASIFTLVVGLLLMGLLSIINLFIK